MIPLDPAYRQRTGDVIFSGRERNFPLILWAGWEVVCGPGYDHRGLGHDRYLAVFQYVLDGCGCVEFRGQTYELRPGTGFLLLAQEPYHRFLPEERQAWEFLTLVFDGSDVMHHVEAIIEQQGPVIHLAADSPALAMACTLLQQTIDSKFVDAESAAIALYQFILTLRRTIMPNALLPEAIWRVLNHLYRHYASEIDLSTMAETANLSRSHFGVLFHQVIGMTPIQYLQRVRVQHAIALLPNSDIAIGDIALRRGFNDPTRFGKVFSSIMGMTPREFRKLPEEQQSISILPPITGVALRRIDGIDRAK